MDELWPPPDVVVGEWAKHIADAAARHPAASPETLGDILYHEVHLGGTGSPPAGPDNELIALLHNVLRADRYVSPGWRPIGDTEVARDGVRLRVTEADIAERGDTTAILLPRIRPRIALGRHVLIAAAGPPSIPAGRIYLNPRDDLETWSAMATAADETGLPWQATFRTDRSDRARPDRIALACDAVHLRPLVDALSTVGTADPVPGLAYRLGPGLAVTGSSGRILANRAALLLAARAPLTNLFTGTPTDG
jgi:hypothetical protein